MRQGCVMKYPERSDACLRVRGSGPEGDCGGRPGFECGMAVAVRYGGMQHWRRSSDVQNAWRGEEKGAIGFANGFRTTCLVERTVKGGVMERIESVPNSRSAVA